MAIRRSPRAFKPTGWRVEVNHARLARWRDRLAAGESLVDAEPALHALLDGEREAILAVYDDWHGIDRSYRRLAHRGSREERVHASESTFWRVLALEGLVLPRQRGREPAAEQPWPYWVEYLPCQVWGILSRRSPGRTRGRLA